MSRAAVFAAIILVVAFVCVQGKPKGIKEEAEILVKNLQDIAAKEINDATIQISELNYEMQTMYTNEFEIIQPKIMEMYENLKQEIDDLQEALGLPATECIIPLLSHIEELPVMMISQVINCMTNKKHTAEVTLQALMSNIREQAERVTDLEMKLSNCVDTACYSDVAMEAADLTGVIPTQILEDLNEAGSIVSSLSLQLRTCSEDQIDKMNEEHSEIIRKIIECATRGKGKSLNHK